MHATNPPPRFRLIAAGFISISTMARGMRTKQYPSIQRRIRLRRMRLRSPGNWRKTTAGMDHQFSSRTPGDAQLRACGLADNALVASLALFQWSKDLPPILATRARPHCPADRGPAIHRGHAPAAPVPPAEPPRREYGFPDAQTCARGAPPPF